MLRTLPLWRSEPCGGHRLSRCWRSVPLFKNLCISVGECAHWLWAGSFSARVSSESCLLLGTFPTNSFSLIKGFLGGLSLSCMRMHKAFALVAQSWDSSCLGRWLNSWGIAFLRTELIHIGTFTFVLLRCGEGGWKFMFSACGVSGLGSYGLWHRAFFSKVISGGGLAEVFPWS